MCSVARIELRVLEVHKETSNIRRDIRSIKLVLRKVQWNSSGDALPGLSKDYLTTSVKVAELCELIVNLVTCHQHGEPYEPPYQVTMACKAIATIVALL